jgi:DNA-binding NtrC family response regulator
MKAQSYDLVISDVDMGHSELSGFELVAKLRREMDFKGIICVHSNRMVSDDYKKAMAMGADSFLPKPMAREHLLKLLLQAASLKANLASPKDAGREKSVKPDMAIVEDDPFIREHWVKSMGTQVKVHHYASPEALAMELERDTTLIQRLSLIVTDYYFDTSPETGMEVGSRVKSLRKGIPVLLSSNGDFKVEKFSGNIDRVISKDPPAKFEDLLT